MVPEITDPVWRKVLLTATKVEFKNTASAMLLTRLKLRLRVDASEANIERCVKEIHAFFVRFQQILGDELEMIKK